MADERLSAGEARAIAEVLDRDEYYYMVEVFLASDAAWRTQDARWRALVTDLLRGGEHDGPCDNEEWPLDDACSLHVAAAEQRRRLAQAALDGGA